MRIVIRVAVVLALAGLVDGGPSIASGQVSSEDLIGCDSKIHARCRKLAKVVTTKIQKCTDRILQCRLAEEIDGKDPTDCLTKAQKRCAKIPLFIAKKRAKVYEKIVLKCGFIGLSPLERYLQGLGMSDTVAACAATDVLTLTSCLVDETQCDAERLVFIADPRANESLTTAGLAATFPCVAPVP